MSKKGFWIAALTALFLAGGAVFCVLNVVLLKDRPGMLPSMADEVLGSRQSELGMTWVARSSSPVEELSVLLQEYPKTHFQWTAGQPGRAHVTLSDPPGWTRLSALVAGAGSVYEWAGVLPSSAAFWFRTGVLSTGPGGHFSVDLVDSVGQTQTLFSETEFSSPPALVSPWRKRLPTSVQFLFAAPAEETGAWHPARVDLSAWSGRPVRILLRLTVGGAFPQGSYGFWGAPRILFPAVVRPTVKRGGPRPPPGTNVVLAVAETTPPGASLEGSPSPLGDFFRGSVFFSRFYTSDTRSGEALKHLLFLSPPSNAKPPVLAPPLAWPRVLKENAYRLVAVGAFSEDMMATLTEAGFDEIHQLPHDGYDPLLAATRGVDWSREGGRVSSLILVFFRDLPRFRYAPVRFWAISLGRFPWSPSRWGHWRSVTEGSYIEESMGRLAETLNGDSGPALVSAVSLRGDVLGSTPVRWPGTGRRGTFPFPERGRGMRESEIRALFALRQGDRWGPGFCRSIGQIPDVGPTLLKALDLPVPLAGGRAWDVGAAVRSEESNGQWVVRSPTAKALIVDGHYKYISHGPPEMRWVRNGGPRSVPVWTDFPSEEIFDLWEDPGERRNLTRSRRHLLARMREVLGEADPTPVDVRLGFLNPMEARVEGAVTCSAGTITEVSGSVPIARGGSYEFSFSTTAASGTVAFQTWPPDSSYSMRFLVNGRPLSSGQFLVSRWGLPLFESVRNEWHDKTEFGWMDGWAPPAASTGPVVSLGRIP